MKKPKFEIETYDGKDTMKLYKEIKMKNKFRYVVVGFYSDGDFEYICSCKSFYDARFEAIYQCKFFNNVNIEDNKTEKIVAKFRNIHGKIEEVEPDGE